MSAQTPVIAPQARGVFSPGRSAVARTAQWISVLAAASTLLSLVAVAAGLSAAAVPLHAPNEMQDLGFPMVTAPVGLFMVVLGGHLRSRGAAGWWSLLTVTGILCIANALLVAVCSLGVNGGLPHGLDVGATWVEQWFYVLPALAAFVVLPMALPAGRVVGRVVGRWRAVLALVLAAGLVPIVGGALGAGPMDDTNLANPIGSGVGSLFAWRDDLYLPTLALALALAAVVAEGMLESPARPGRVPWLPVALAVPLAVCLWSRVSLVAAHAPTTTGGLSSSSLA